MKPPFLRYTLLLLALASAIISHNADAQELAKPKHTYLVTPSASSDDIAEIRAIHTSANAAGSNEQTQNSYSSFSPSFDSGSSSSGIELFPIASVRVSRELLASVSFGFIFSTDAEMSFYHKNENLAVSIIEALIGYVRYHASGPSIQAEVGVTGVKASVGYTQIDGANIIYVLPIDGVGYTIKGSVLHKWSDLGGNNLLQTGQAGATYVGPEVDFMYSLMKFSLGVMKRVSGPNDLSGDWILTAGVGIGL